MKELLFKDWPSLGNIALCAIISYLALFLFIRISGKRTLAKLNAFDFVVTVTLGSTLSSMILGKTTVAEGLVAIIIIILLQYALAWLANKSQTAENVINSSPTLLFYNGLFLKDAMDKEVITQEEIYAEVRKYRLHRMEDVKAVILELSGDITVVKKAEGSPATSLEDLDTEV